MVGDVFAQDRVEIRPGGSVDPGNIRSSRILIADGARLKGSVEMVKPAAEAPAPKPPAAPATKRAATPQSPGQARLPRVARLPETLPLRLVPDPPVPLTLV